MQIGVNQFLNFALDGSELRLTSQEKDLGVDNVNSMCSSRENIKLCYTLPL